MDKNPKNTGPEDRDLRLLVMIYSVIGVILLLLMQIGRYKSTSQRFQVTGLVLAIVLGIGYRVTRKFKKGMQEKEKRIEALKKKEEED